MTTWHEAEEPGTYYAETDDPRVLAIIQHDMEPQAPYGDALAPAYWLDHQGGWSAERAGSVFHDDASDAAAAAYAALIGYYLQWRDDREEVAARHLRIFHGITALEMLSDGSGRRLMIFDTPSYRERVGMPDDLPDPLAGEREEWRAYLDGDAFGIGYAVNLDRTTTETPVSEAWSGFDVEMQCWGFYGREHAKESALTFDGGEPDLPALIDQAGVVFA